MKSLNEKLNDAIDQFNEINIGNGQVSIELDYCELSHIISSVNASDSYEKSMEQLLFKGFDKAGV